ncbi:BTB/POZ domain-containing protein [Rhizophagus clarus]|uniref:BTB/POZ domain-containing protein n=1 Tax=Rhizophagus clarus TaxID=94130 RepID=A0A8H3LFT3_9GLOM|nr:BTB/POZ domain-containing protein [Rhizophagus clarus]
MSFEYSQEIVNDLEKLLETDEEYNVIIYAGENENIKEIHAHSILLRIRSQYFRTALSKESFEKKDGKYAFNFPNISPQFFKIILRFIYCGKIDLAKLRGPDVLKLLIAVDELKIQTLILCIQEYLVKHQQEFLQQNPLEILETVYQRESFTNLWNYYLEEISAKPDILLKSDKFINLKAPSLELLLKRDDLSLDEIDIWDSLIRWGFFQHPSIQQDVKKWNKEEITIMERTLHKFIPLIRFYHIDSEDFFIKVYPFKILIPDDILDNKPKHEYDSVIIGPKHFAIFSSWIENKNETYYNERNIPYNFNLIFRSNRDGNTPAAFHAKCDNKGATIVIAKISNSEQILGGYNPLQWDSNNEWKYSSDSFIFSFTNGNNFQTAKVGRVIANCAHDAIFCNINYGPAFGGGCDLFHFNNDTWKSYYVSYSRIDIPQGNMEEYNVFNIEEYNVFNVENYEVFQVVKK